MAKVIHISSAPFCKQKLLTTQLSITLTFCKRVNIWERLHKRNWTINAKNIESWISAWLSISRVCCMALVMSKNVQNVKYFFQELSFYAPNKKPNHFFEFLYVDAWVLFLCAILSFLIFPNFHSYQRILRNQKHFFPKVMVDNWLLTGRRHACLN